MENCPEGLRSCGIIDTLNQTLCLPTNLKCPLNDIEIISKDSSIADKYRQEGYSYEYGSNNMMIFYTFSQTSKPIIGRILLNDELPCANPTQRSWRKSISYENSNSQYCTDDYKGSFTIIHILNLPKLLMMFCIKRIYLQKIIINLVKHY